MVSLHHALLVEGSMTRFVIRRNDGGQSVLLFCLFCRNVLVLVVAVTSLSEGIALWIFDPVSLVAVGLS